MQLQQENQISKTNLLRKCGLLAHTSAAFLKNCCTEKLFIRLRLVLGNLPNPVRQGWGTSPNCNSLFNCSSLIENNVSKENGLSHPAKGGSTPAFACQRAAIAPLPCLNLQSCFS